MTATCHSLHTPALVALGRACKDAGRALARTARGWADAWQRKRLARSRQRELLSLHALNDHLLRDLGIDRNELIWLAANPEDPTRARFTPLV